MNEVIDEIAVPYRPDVAGLRFRHFEGPADYPGMVAASQASRDEAGIEEVITVEAISRAYSHLVNCDLTQDMVVVERDRAIIGYARVEWRELVDGRRSFMTVCILQPAQRGQGIGRALLAWSEDRLAAKAAALPAGPEGAMDAYTWGNDDHAISLFEKQGWSRNGYGFEMVRPTLDDIPEVPLPDGLEVRPMTLDDRERVWWASVDAFRDHRLEPEPTPEDLAEFLEDSRQDPSLWAVAFDGDEVAGGVLGLIDRDENEHHGRQRGLLDSVFTRAGWRRRGLARALIARTLVLLRDRGMTSAYLGVDGLNPNQAQTLYASLGFEIVSSTIDWTKPLPRHEPVAGGPNP